MARRGLFDPELRHEALFDDWLISDGRVDDELIDVVAVPTPIPPVPVPPKRPSLHLLPPPRAFASPGGVPRAVDIVIASRPSVVAVVSRPTIVATAINPIGSGSQVR